MTDEHIQILEDGGLVEQTILMVPVTQEAIEDFCIMDCTVCAKDMEDATRAYVWGEPLGGYVALKVHCSTECVDESMTAYADKVQKDLIVVWVARPGWQDEED